MSLNKYILEQYGNNPLWFTEEVKQSYHIARISKVINNKNYLKGLHEILNRPDVIHKGTEFVTSKMILQTIKTILNFHKTYILGKRVTLTGSDDMVKSFESSYRKGKFHKNNFSVIDNILKYGDAFEYVYFKDGKITSKIFDCADSYPIYNDRMEYVGFIEYYCDLLSNIEYYNVYSDSKVESWTNEGGQLHKVSESVNISGLPIHYKNTDDLFGESIIDDLKPILDKIEILINRMDDAVYTLSLNPLGVVSGQQLSDSVDGEALGYVLSLEDGGEFKFAVAQLDSASCKLLLDTLWSQLWTIAQVPSIVMGQSNISNVSEVSLKLLFSLANNKALEHGIYLRDGFDIRHEQMEKLFKYSGVRFSEHDYIDVVFNLSRPQDEKEQIENLSKQYNDGSISLESYVESSPLITDSVQELNRLRKV